MNLIRKMLVIMLCMILTGSYCMAASDGELGGISPYYVGTQTTNEIFNISSSGVASMTTSLTPKKSVGVDEVKVTLKIKNASGVVKYNKTYTATWSDLYGAFRLSKTYQLPGSGSYQFQATYKCYKDGSLLETINSGSILDSY